MIPPPDDRSTSDSDTLSPGLRRIADVILWVAAVGFAIGLAYFIIVPGQRTARVSSFVFWYAAPALVVLLAVWALRSSAERRIASAILLLSAIGSALAAEARAGPLHNCTSADSAAVPAESVTSPASPPPGALTPPPTGHPGSE